MATVIVGAGFAGIATAYHLARRGASGITVLEKEETAGMHASGRNAGLLRQSSHDPDTAGLLRRGARAARRILQRVPGALQPTGSLILGAGVDALQPGPRAEIIEAGTMVPGLTGRALFDPDDALVDPQALLSAYMDGARRRGVQFRFGEELVGVDVRDGRVVGVETSRGTMETDTVVNASGAWAGQVAGLAGAAGFAVEPRRRHLFRGTLDTAGSEAWPFVWHESAGVYFRPEGDGMLLSPCDAEAHAACAPELDDARRDELAGKIAETFGELGEWRLGSGWACLRTFAPDERFVIGPDPRLGGLFWVATLGGHGMTASWAVGELAANLLLGRPASDAFDPGRF